MLTEEQKRQIREEEIFRDEIRSEVSTSESARGFKIKLWMFLNSSFGIWFLSSVLVTSAVAGYQWLEQYNYRSAESRKQASYIDLEIHARSNRALEALRNAETNNDISNAIGRLDEGSSIFPQYQDRKMLSLIQEQIVLVPNSEKQELREARDQIPELFNHQRRLNEHDIAGNRASAEERKNIKMFIDDLLLERWRNPDA